MEYAATARTLPHIRDLLQDVHGVCKLFQLVSLNRQLEATDHLLEENSPIDVAILGQFKAGKSSFINSLIGKPVLPVGAIPVTTAITRLQYGERERVVVRHFDGTITEASLDTVADFTAEAKNPGNMRNVEIVDVELPSLHKYEGLRLVDTPGLGSVFKYHIATAKDWLPEVGAALLAVSSDRPLSENDMELIRELTRHTPNIILLLTKTDLLSEDQQQEVVQFFKQTLQWELNRELPIYFYSTRIRTEQYKEQIERNILDRIAANRSFEFQRILRYKTQSLVKGCIAYLDIALKTAMQADQDREGLRTQILNERVNEALVREEMGMIARENERQTRPLIKAYLERFQAPLTKKIIEKLCTDMPGWRGNLWKLTRRYEAWMSETMTEEIQRISRAEQHHFYGTLKKAHAGLSRSLEAFRRFLDENIQKVLGVRLADVEWKIEVVEPERPDVIATKSFDIHLDLIWFLIPMVIFRRLFERHYVNGVPWEVEKNLSRLAAQWEKGINGTIEAMYKQAMTYVHDELTTVESLLSKTQGQTDEIRQLISRFQTQLELLSA